MRRLTARASGALAGNASWKGRVLSLHPRAANILRSDGLVVSLLADGPSMSAMGVLVPELFEIPIDQGLVDAAAEMDGGVLSIDSFASIDCAGSRVWEGTVDDAAVRAIPRERVRAVRGALLNIGRPGGLLGILHGGEADNPFAARVRASLEGGRLGELVGCGPGLTPSGDDFLAGALLASAASPCKAHIESRLPGTTPAGRTLLWMALQGRFPACLVAFIEAITGAAVSVGGVHDAVRSTCTHGETSGTDALAGFCWRALQKD